MIKMSAKRIYPTPLHTANEEALNGQLEVNISNVFHGNVFHNRLHDLAGDPPPPLHRQQDSAP